MPRIVSLNDEEGILAIIHLFLERKGYQHLETTDSRHALSILRQEPIDLLIQDMLRPDINGFELYWMMKSEEKLRDIPILIYSGWDSAKVKVTPARVAGRKLQGLYRTKFEGVEPKDLTAVRRIKQANVLYVEGYLGLPCSRSKLVGNINRILKSHSLLTEEERAIRHKHLWSQAV